MPFERLEYIDIEKYIYKAADSDKPYIYNANISILIMCAHMFMNFTNMWSISHREKPYVKLGELWDVFEMTKHNSYSKETLLKLIENYKAHDCIKWAGIILNMVFGSNPLPLDVSNETINDYPKCLWWNIWRYIPSNICQLLSTKWYVIDDVFSNVVVNKLPIGLYYFSDLVHIGTKINCNFSILFDRNWGHIIYDKHSTKIMRYRIDFGCSAIEIISDDNKHHNIVGDTDLIEVSTNDTQITFKLVYDKFILGVQEKNEFNKSEMLIPIYLERMD